MTENNSKFSYYFNKWARVIILLPFLFFPDNFFEITSIYHSETLSNIAYKWLNFDFSFAFIIIFILAIPLIVKKKRMFLLFSVLIFVRSIFFYLLNKPNIFQYNSFEIQLSFLSAWTLFIIIEKYIIRYFNADWYKLFEFFCWMHLFSQIIGMLLSFSGFSGRFNAINLDVENTAFLFCFYVIAEQEKNKSLSIKNYFFILGILLSGARIPLLIMLFVLAIQKLLLYIDNAKRHKAKLWDLIEIILLASAVLVFTSGNYINLTGALSGINRIIDGFTKGDASYLGRINSLIAGFKILQENYLGIDCSFVILQEYMNHFGYPTFPHSQFLLWRIILGPFIFWAGIIIFAVKVRRGLKSKTTKIMPLLFILLYFTTTGNPLSNYKLIFIYLVVIYISLNFNNIIESNNSNKTKNIKLILK